MFRKDFKLERLAQDEESRKVELAEKQKALSGAKKRMEDLDRLIQHIYEDNVLGELSDSRYLRRSRRRLSSLPLLWNGKLNRKPGSLPM